MPKRLERRSAALEEGLIMGMVRLLQKKVGLDQIESELLRELEGVESVGAIQPILFEPGILSSEDLNKNFEGMYKGLSSIYRSLLTLDGKRQRNVSLFDSSEFRGEQAVLKLLQDLRAFKKLKLNPTYNDIRIVDFNDSRNDAIGGAKLTVDDYTRV